LFDEFFEDLEGHGDEVQAHVLFPAEPILEAAFAPAGEIALADVWVSLGCQPGDDVFVVFVAGEAKTYLVPDGGREARDFAGAAVVAMPIGSSPSARERRDGWIVG
jgi:hypothetical protein